MDWQKIMKEIEDDIIPHYRLDIWERGMYYYLLGQTRIRDIEYRTIPLSALSQALMCSAWKAREVIRLLAKKGCIEVEQTRTGHNVKVFLPTELDIPLLQEKKEDLNIEDIDFFRNREYVGALLEREGNSCFYCLKDISLDTCELDHVVPQLNGGDNSYRNIVVTCHRCNTHKQGTDAEDYLRQMYRKSLINESELEERLSALEALKNGDLLPAL
jgi:5-methylcytosine-specific restriction endonuclease McrA